ncbi:putative subtilisin-like serine protease [Rosellinia necatrix]|uniref:Putative subtilisin-like serine protease n=1 Tax=Rosellinia necatrix TaxID=77044 RepID=A0A1W2TWV0_ROSNE|nr:putative subtilisin-like serine protease [Rosellinia necatrix]
MDNLPASFRDIGGKIQVPNDKALPEFLSRELSLAKLETYQRWFWAIGARRPAQPLNHQIASGRTIIVDERLDMHLIWANNGNIFIKPLPRFLLDPDIWERHLHDKPSDPSQSSPPTSDSPCPPSQELRRCALGLLYTYACLIAYESDFAIANEKRLLPRRADGAEIRWEDWRRLVREALEGRQKWQQWQRDNKDGGGGDYSGPGWEVHPRFERGELRLSRLNLVSRYTRFPPFTSYVRGWRSYSSLIGDNVTSLATAAIFIALVLTAMQVGLATDRLKDNATFGDVSYVFSIIAIIAPLAVFVLIVAEAIYNLVKDNLCRKRPGRKRPGRHRDPETGNATT